MGAGFRANMNYRKIFWHTGWLHPGTQLKKRMSKMITKNNFKKEVAERSFLSLVNVTTEWNGASQIVSMMYEDVANAYKGVVNFHTVDYETEKALGREYGVMEIPTILFFESGQLIDHAVGLIPKNILIAKIETALSK